MTDEDAAVIRARQLLELKAEVADAITAVAALDMALVMLIADIIQKHPIAGQDLEVASLLVFSQNTIERRIDIVRKLIAIRFKALSKVKPHEYAFKVHTFITKAFNIIAADATKEIWIRNTVAHSNYMLPQNGPPKIIPAPFDFEGVQRHNERKGIKSPDGFAFDTASGFTATELKAFSTSMAVPPRRFNQLRTILITITSDGPAEILEAQLVALGKDLQLQAPLRARPHRGKREPRQPK